MFPNSHNVAFHLLADLCGFGWPILFVTFVIACRSLFSGDGDETKGKVFLVGGVLVAINLLFLLLDDGGQIFYVAERHHGWGAVLGLGVGMAAAALIRGLRGRQAVDAAMLQGVLDQPADERQHGVWTASRLGYCAGVFLGFALLWLVAMARGPVF